jgi:hypothetical protein
MIGVVLSDFPVKIINTEQIIVQGPGKPGTDPPVLDAAFLVCGKVPIYPGILPVLIGKQSDRRSSAPLLQIEGGSY